MSPIEKTLYDALIANRPSNLTVYDEIGGAVHEATEDVGHLVALSHQEQVGPYRIDLMLTTNSGRRLAVECDGHDWHDRTKQQAAYDRSRDRDLLKQRILTARFTGSEIHHSPERCAAEVYQLLAVILEDEDREMESSMRAFDAGRNSVSGAPKPKRGDL